MTDLLPEIPDGGFRIMLMGGARTGKTTIAEMIAEQFYDTMHIAFADQLKIQSAKMVNTAVEHLGINREKWNPIDTSSIEEINKHRHMLRGLWQWFGTDFVRDLDADFWIKALASQIHSTPEEKRKYIVVPDCRFPNECFWGIKNGFIVVRINRTVKEMTRDHSSESHWHSLPFHLEYNNDKSLEEMHYWIMDKLIPFAKTRGR